MAVKAQPHSEPWKVVLCDGTVIDKFSNAREALSAARRINFRARRFKGYPAVSAVRA